LVYSKLGLDLVPRLGPIAVSPKEVGIVALHNVHMTSDETAKNTSVSWAFDVFLLLMSFWVEKTSTSWNLHVF
jgi:hypothetical protein